MIKFLAGCPFSALFDVMELLSGTRWLRRKWPAKDEQRGPPLLAWSHADGTLMQWLGAGIMQTEPFCNDQRLISNGFSFLHATERGATGTSYCVQARGRADGALLQRQVGPRVHSGQCFSACIWECYTMSRRTSSPARGRADRALQVSRSLAANETHCFQKVLLEIESLITKRGCSPKWRPSGQKCCSE